MTETQVTSRGDQAHATEISQQLHRLIDARSARAAAYGPGFEELWNLAGGCLTGGKLLRPRLLLGAFDALAASSPERTALRPAALELAAALEVLHFSFLLHDDVIDEDLMRRGEPNLVGKMLGGVTAHTNHTASTAELKKLHWARSSALLVGDLMLTIAHQSFARAAIPEPQRLRALDLLDAAVTETVAGEYCDVGLAGGRLSPDLGLVLEMTRMKTASYTFELPLRLAAVIANADPSIEQQLGGVGRHLGVAFQLQDDVLSAFSSSDIHGKDQFSDFREGKETALIAYARMTDTWPSIEQLLGAPDFTNDCGRRVQRLLDECGARRFVESMVQDQLRAALDILAQGDEAVPPGVSHFVLALIESLEGRRT